MSSWDNEKPPVGRTLLPEGWRGLTITYAEKTVSKAGNPMFEITVEDEETKYPTKIYIVSVPGKRWTLKTILEAVGVDKQEDDDYDYSPELLNERLSGLVVHEDSIYIDRQGNEVKAKQHRFVEFKKHTSNPDGVTSADQVEWNQ